MPLLDMFNHHEESNIHITYSSSHNAFLASANQPIKPGEELTLYYGLYSNAEMLCYYGFMHPENSIQSIHIPMDKVCEHLDFLPEDSPAPRLFGQTVSNESEESLQKLLTKTCKGIKQALEKSESYEAKPELEQMLIEEKFTLKAIAAAANQRQAELQALTTASTQLSIPDPTPQDAYHKQALNQLIIEEQAALADLHGLLTLSIDVIETPMDPFSYAYQIRNNRFGELYLDIANQRFMNP